MLEVEELEVVGVGLGAGGGFVAGGGLDVEELELDVELVADDELLVLVVFVMACEADLLSLGESAFLFCACA